jgi:hypothetical protein
LLPSNAKIRPGFIYYENALPGGGDATPLADENRERPSALLIERKEK